MSIFLHIPSIYGAVSAKGHEGWMACLSCEHGMGRRVKATTGYAHDREEGTFNMSALVLTKELDKASPYLFQLASQGKVIPQAHLHVCQPDAELSPYLKYCLSNVMVSQRHLALQGNFRPVESLTLHFTKIEESYIPYNAQNQAQSPIVVGYNLETATNL